MKKEEALKRSLEEKNSQILFLSDLLLTLGEMAGSEAREACRNVVLLVSSLVMIGHVTLRPLISIGAPFQDPTFQIPEPLGGGLLHF